MPTREVDPGAECHYGVRRSNMTDLERLGLGLVGFAVAVMASGVLLGLIGAWINKRRNG